jgi:hypothetical protein
MSNMVVSNWKFLFDASFERKIIQNETHLIISLSHKKNTSEEVLLGSQRIETNRVLLGKWISPKVSNAVQSQTRFSFLCI